MINFFRDRDILEARLRNTPYDFILMDAYCHSELELIREYTDVPIVFIGDEEEPPRDFPAEFAYTTIPELTRRILEAESPELAIEELLAKRSTAPERID